MGGSLPLWPLAPLLRLTPPIPQFIPPKTQKPAMIPRGVVAHVFPEQGLNRSHLSGGVVEIKVRDEPLPVGPDMVVFRVEREDGGQERQFG